MVNSCRVVCVYLQVVEFYISQTEAANHAVREAACACIAELGTKVARAIILYVCVCVVQALMNRDICVACVLYSPYAVGSAVYGNYRIFRCRRLFNNRLNPLSCGMLTLDTTAT